MIDSRPKHRPRTQEAGVAIDIFGRRERSERATYGDRLPPGQRLTDGWPVLHYGGIPRFDKETWRFEVVGLVEEKLSLSYDELRALPNTTIHCDIHCVTHWSKFDNDFTGVKLTDLMQHVRLKPEAMHVMVHSHGCWTTMCCSPGRTTARISSRSTAGRCASWCQSSTSGRAPSGCGACSSSTASAPAFGRRTGTTSTATRGARSAIRSFAATRTAPGSRRDDGQAASSRLRLTATATRQGARLMPRAGPAPRSGACRRRRARR